MSSYIQFSRGIKRSLPIALGYFPISFTFGIMASSEGIHPLIATVISLSNFTSAGQFAGTQLILQGVDFIELGMTIFVINLRYMLMSFALTQKIQQMSWWKKLIIAHGVTDEIFVLSTLEKNKIEFSRLAGMIIGPYIGWGMGTLIGAYASNLLTLGLQQAMGSALYAMFIALLIPAAKKNRNIFKVIIMTLGISAIITYFPIFSALTDGWKIIIITLVGSGIGALFFPNQEEEEQLCES